MSFKANAREELTDPFCSRSASSSTGKITVTSPIDLEVVAEDEEETFDTREGSGALSRTGVAGMGSKVNFCPIEGLDEEGVEEIEDKSSARLRHRCSWES